MWSAANYSIGWCSHVSARTVSVPPPQVIADATVTVRDGAIERVGSSGYASARSCSIGIA